MRFTKGMKKALSFALSAALVLTSAAIAPKASADDAVHTGAIDDPDYKATMSVTASGAAISDVIGLENIATGGWNANKNDQTGDPGDTSNGFVFFVTADAMKKMANYNDPMVKFMSDDVASVSVQEQISWGTTSYEVNKAISIKDLVATYTAEGVTWQGLAITVPCDATVSVLFYDAKAKTKEQIEQEMAEQLAKEAAIEEEMRGKASTYVDGNMNAFKVYGVYSDTSWTVSDWGTPASAMSITKDGTYEVKMATASGDFEDINMLWLETNLYDAAKINSNFSITIDKLTVGSTDYTPVNKQEEVEAAKGTRHAGNKVYTAQNVRYTGGFEDIMVDCKAAGEKMNLKDYLAAYRVNLCNPYNAATKSPKAVEDKWSYVNPECEGDDKGYTTDAFYNKTISGKMGDKMVLTITVKGMGSTPALSGAATKSIKAAKKSVVVAAGKSTTVAYTVTKAATAAKAAGVTVSSANTKVAKASISGGKIKITVPKKATKGASTTVTVKSGSASAKIKVTVKNPIKKISAKKKASIKKKGKTAKITVKLTATNKKKATTDKITVKSSKKKVVKVTKIGKASKSKVVITVKGVKKGNSTLTIKVGSKKVKVKVTVKK